MSGAVKALVDATILASTKILEGRGVKVDCGKLVAPIKQVVKGALPTVMQEWEQATEANISEGWLRKMLNTQAVELGIEAADLYQAA